LSRYREPTRRTPFNVHDPEEAQARQLMAAAFDVAGARDRVTDIFVDLRPIPPA